MEEVNIIDLIYMMHLSELYGRHAAMGSSGF